MKTLFPLFPLMLLLLSCTDESDMESRLLWQPQIHAELAGVQVKILIENTSHRMDYIVPLVSPDHLEVYFSNDSTSLELYQRIMPDSKVVVFSDLLPGKKYFFNVKAIKQKFKTESSDTLFIVPD